MIARRSSAALGAIVAIALVLMPAPAAIQRRDVPPAPPIEAPVFEEVSRAWGLDFDHVNGASAEKYLPETMGSGGLFFDYDNDGWVDVFVVDGGSFADKARASRARHRLFRNAGNGSFEDATASSGIVHRGYGMGACAADYDNDGFVDLFVTGVAANTLYRNLGNGRFRDVTQERRRRVVGVEHELRVRGLRQGWLGRPVRHELRRCHARQQQVLRRSRQEDSRLLPPAQLPAAAGRALPQQRKRRRSPTSAPRPALPRTAGTDWAWSSPTTTTTGGRTCSWPTIRCRISCITTRAGVCSRRSRCSAGVAVANDGKARAGMGTDFGDYDGDGRLDLVVTNHEFETTTLFRNLGKGLFADATTESGIGPATLPFVGFGAALFDYDNDGRLDLAIANGHVVDNTAQMRASSTLRAAPAAVPQHRRPPVRGGRTTRRVPASRETRSDGRSRSPTSTTTAISICWSPTTVRRWISCATTAAIVTTR